MIFLLKFIPIYVLIRDVKDFVMTVTIKSKNNTTQTGISKNLAKFVLWSGHFNADFSSTDQKDLKLDQFPDMDDMTSPSKFW